MSRLERVFLLLGLGLFVLLARKMDPSTVLGALRTAGWGLAFLVALELGAYLFNTLGWRACLAPEHRTVPLLRLIRIRIVGDALNYLVPSAAVAGELTKTSMLGEQIPLASRLSSTFMAKLAQILAMILTAGTGLAVLLLQSDLGGLHGKAVAGFYGLLALAAALAILGFLFVSGRLERLLEGWSLLQETSAAARDLIRERPDQLALAVGWCTLGYLWGALEGYWICRLLGFPVSWAMALKIEVLSIFLDAALFYVPAKAGTQESTKALIFLAFGRPAAQGFSFGLVRHFRELTWAGIGLALSRRAGRPAKAAPRRPPASLSLA